MEMKYLKESSLRPPAQGNGAAEAEALHVHQVGLARPGRKASLHLDHSRRQVGNHLRAEGVKVGGDRQ